MFLRATYPREKTPPKKKDTGTCECPERTRLLFWGSLRIIIPLDESLTGIGRQTNASDRWKMDGLGMIRYTWIPVVCPLRWIDVYVDAKQMWAGRKGLRVGFE